MKYDIVKLMARRKIRWKKRWVSSDSGGRLTFRSKKAGRLSDYRIYGNTVGGESVGDLVESGEHEGEYKVPVTVEGKNLVTSYLVEPNGGIQFTPVIFAEVNLQPNTEYLITFYVHENGVKLYSNDLLFTSINYSSEIQGKETMRLKTKTSIRSDQHINNKGWVLLRNARQNLSNFTITDVKLQLVSDAPIYLPEPIKMVGDEAEYIDYAEQKQHRVRKNLLNILANTTIINSIHFTVNSDKSITIDGNLDASKSDLYLIVTDSLILDRGEYLVSCENASTNAKFIIGGSPSTGYVPYTEIIDSNSVEVSCSGGGIGFCLIRVTSDIETPITLYPMIRKADIEDDTYEPYIENTDIDVTLPALPTLTGTNVLSVGTAVQPSRVEVKGKIKAVGQETEPEPETAEAEQETAEAEQETAEAEQE